MKLSVFEILVPTQYGDTFKPISTKHHKNWDAYIRKTTGGLTIMGVAKGQWVHQDTNLLYSERVIPVRIACKSKQMESIVDFTLNHYRQEAVMYYKLSDEVTIKYKK